MLCGLWIERERGRSNATLSSAMEAGSSLLSASPPAHLPRIHITNPFSSPSVPMLHDQTSRAVTSMQTTSLAQHCPTPVLLQEQHYALRPLITKEDKIGQLVLDGKHLESGMPEKRCQEFTEYLKFSERRLLHGFVYLLPPFCMEENPLSFMPLKSVANDTDVSIDIKQMPGKKRSFNLVQPQDAVTLAKKAIIASQEAASLAKNLNRFASNLNEPHFPGLGPQDSTTEVLIREEVTVRSNRLLERRAKKRRLPKKPNTVFREVSSSIIKATNRRITKEVDSNDPLSLFLWGPETKQLLTVTEEKDLFVHIQELMRLKEVKERLQIQFNREPTLVEWAAAVGMSCQTLQSCLYSGTRSRETMLYANFRLVVHVAKKYHRNGLSIQDLLQEGSMGLMKSLERFKPKVGCRFATYAYWWIRQSIRKAIFQYSRTIRLPENVFAVLKKIKDARKLYVQEGHFPTNEDVAKRVGITVERLEMLLSSSRTPISIQQHAWRDQDTTFQEVIADPDVENPDRSVAKQMMRQHVRNLLRTLPQRERQIIQFRYGIRDGERKSLSEIGAIFGLSKERVRQLESRALDQLKACHSSQGLETYVDLLI